MINMDFTKDCLVHTEDLSWLPSPLEGVHRKQLEREAAESGHVTSIVKYESNSFFPRHKHPLGEEIYVLRGTFSDESGDYGPGSYIRNPPGSSHTPYSEGGCLLFVKLNQFLSNDLYEVQIDYDESTGSTMFHEFGHYSTSILKLNPYEKLNLAPAKQRQELFVISGQLEVNFNTLKDNSWLRTNKELNIHNNSAETSHVLLFKF